LTNFTKDELRERLLEAKQWYIDKNAKRLEQIRPRWGSVQTVVPDIENIQPYIEFCTTQERRDLWFYGRLIVSSAPWTGDVGRRFQYLIRDKDTGFIIGMVGLSSSLSIPLFDKHVGWTREQKWKNHMINHTMNMSHCVATSPLNQYLTGKLCALSCRSKEIIEYFESTYNDRAVCWMTTSLFGKSSVYNRLDGFKYLGNTKGFSAVLIPPEIREKMRKEYQEKHGKHSEVYTKPDGTVVKYGTVKTFQKLSKYTKVQRVENLRGVYCIPLAHNYKGFLRGETDELQPFEHPTFDELFQYWMDRWCLPRVQRIKDGLI